MRTIWAACTLAAAAAMSLAGAVEARDWASVKQSGRLLAATEGAFAPFNYFQGEKLTGYEVDVGEAVAKKLGVAIEWKALAFDALIPAVQQGRYDFGIASHGITAERQKSVDFAHPHYCTGGRIITRAGGPTTAAALRGKVVGVQLATTYAGAVKKLTGLKEVKTYPKDTDAQQALMAGRIDAWVTDRFVGKAAMDKNPKAGLVAGDMLFTERVAMIVQKNNPALLEALNGALDALSADGTLKALGMKYFGEDIRCGTGG